MNANIFDAVSRMVAEVPRRDVTRALLGLVLGGIGAVSLITSAAGAKNGKKGKKHKKRAKRKKNKNANRTPTCIGNCSGKVCGDDGCGASCGQCGPGELCAQGVCVTGIGTCDVGQDVCIDAAHVCPNASGVDCLCWTSMSEQTRCGQINPISAEIGCRSDSDCAQVFADVPGAFCMKDTGDRCVRGGLCVAPCPPS